MQRSRRLLFVLSPEFLAEKSFSLFECRLGLYLAHAQKANIVTVGYRSVSKLPGVEVVQIRKAAGTMVTWRGKRSESPRSRFWLRLRLSLPVRPLALGRRMIDSTSSHSDLAAFVLQKHYRETANQGRALRKSLANHSRGSRQSSVNQSLHRERQGAVTDARRRCSGWVEVKQEVRPESVNQRGPASLTEATNQVGDEPLNPTPLPDSTRTAPPQQEARAEEQTCPAHLADSTNAKSRDPDPDGSRDQLEMKPTSVYQTGPAPLSHLTNQLCVGPPDPAPLPDSTEMDLADTDSTPFTSFSAHNSDPTVSPESSCAIIMDLPDNSKDLDPTLSSDSAPFTDSALSECLQEAEETQQTNTAA
ncbi:uncharacterized protein [Eucyclogobius newberryi]|uniref:uncharacterized protein n=1 Tax=Eucyclogobius newberryi TaxID=166745 RepID=UPI003B5CD0C5